MKSETPACLSIDVTPYIVNPGTMERRRGVKVLFDAKAIDDCLKNNDEQFALQLGEEIISAFSQFPNGEVGRIEYKNGQKVCHPGVS